MTRDQIVSLLNKKVKHVITDQEETVIKGIHVGNVIFFVDSFLLEEDWNPDNTMDHVHDDAYVISTKINKQVFSDLYKKDKDGQIKDYELI